GAPEVPDHRRRDGLPEGHRYPARLRRERDDPRLRRGRLSAAMDELTSDALTADYRVLQRKRGHRYSLDDVLTAYVACEAEPEAAEVLDLGTGIGSVLMMVAWKRPAARLVGVEAQEGSYALLQENLEANGLAARVRTIHGDFREPEVRAAIGGRFSLVTGTPPYFPP